VKATIGRTAAVTVFVVEDEAPMAADASALAQKLNRFLALKPDELASLARLEARRRPIPAQTEIVHERQEGHHAFILQKGLGLAKRRCEGSALLAGIRDLER
jgi:hypothetical protein